MELTREEWLAQRRARREARRAKQREDNFRRAANMHEERLAYEAEHDGPCEMNDPPLPYYVGCSGWYYWHWGGTFYPKTIPGNRWFPFYASHFDTVELNAPFYSWPTSNAVRTWLKQALRRRFIYTVKACELITHVKRFARTRELVKDFGHIADILGKRMGCFLFQLPPSYHYSKARLDTILSQLDPSRRNVVEFRHRSWWRDNVYSAFEKVNAIFCSCSGPRLPDELVKTSDELYVRFHGITNWYRHDYSEDELAVWVDRIKSSGAKKVWAYFNNDRECFAIKNARELLKQLKRSSSSPTGRGQG